MLLHSVLHFVIVHVYAYTMYFYMIKPFFYIVTAALMKKKQDLNTIESL